MPVAMAYAMPRGAHPVPVTRAFRDDARPNAGPNTGPNTGMARMNMPCLHLVRGSSLPFGSGYRRIVGPMIRAFRVSSIRLLIIEDSATARAIIEQLVVQEPDAQVVGVAATAEEAHALLRTLKPNVITLDLNMPGVGGMAFLDTFADDRHAPIVVLSSSSRAGSDVASEAMKRGAAACFDKASLTREAARFRSVLHHAMAKHDRAAMKSVYS